MANLEQLLSRKIGDVERPKAKPAGWYLLSVNQAALVESSKKKTPGVEITFDFLAPHEDINPDLLKDVKIQGTQIKETFWLTDASLWRLFGDMSKGVEGFVQMCGLSPSADRSLIEVIKELSGAQVMGEISEDVSDNGEMTFNRIQRFRKV